MAPNASSISVFARHLVATKVKLPSQPLRLHRGRIAIAVSCPATAQAWCYGTWQAWLSVGRSVRVRSKSTELLVPTGKTRHLSLNVPAGALHGVIRSSRLQLRLVATTREPFGGRAVAAATRTVRGR
jgi:hypothetical protein